MIYNPSNVSYLELSRIMAFTCNMSQFEMNASVAHQPWAQFASTQNMAFSGMPWPERGSFSFLNFVANFHEIV